MVFRPCGEGLQDTLQVVADISEGVLDGRGSGWEDRARDDAVPFQGATNRNATKRV